ncbi:hypothetical protein BC941DRAFT_89973 [Chlamydoabsidia padenii]|nr:hypothetical protein BC941DRAFT_89973 [Chlamydoabsidia padenii]
MTSPLLVNTHLNRQQGRWQPSINTSTIREEDGLQRTVEENEVDGDDDDDDDDNVALGHLGKNGVNSEEELDPDDEDDEDDEDDDEDEDDDDDEDETNEDEDDDSSTFTSSPSIPDENIDFDLVYTLHTFEATVEGQASVVKGDSLTLLDDSNSYWWLVKVLKSNEVGYIPAENIETPFERLARLNKHRNVEVTAIQQASHYINPEDEAAKAISKKQRKQVTMNKDIYYQSHIILLGDDDEELEETYEEWEGDMVDEDSQSTMLASEDDNGMDTSDTEMDQGDEQPSNNTTTDEEVQGLRITTSSAATTSNGATRPTTSDDLNNKDSTTATKQLPTKPTPLTTTAQSSSSPIVSPNGTTPLTPISTLKDDKENKKHGGSFLRLFSRGKRQDGKKLGGSQTYPMDNTSDQGSTNSSTISADDSQQQSTVPASSSTSSMTALDPSATVLRVYAGNINVNATYNSVLVYDHTNAEALLRQAMDRFHISQIEGKARGKRSSMTSSPSQYPHQQHSSGVEYYISVKPNDGDELTLLPQDKPLIIYQSLTAHLTTPMPSLSSLKQQITNVEFGRIGSPANNSSSNKRTGTKFGEDSIRFYLHKRIKRVNEQDGKLYVKVSLYHENDVTKRDRKNSDNGKQRSVSSNSVGISSSNNHNDSKHSIHGGSYTSLSTGSFSMRRKKSTSATVNSLASTTTATSGTQSQIDKLIAVSSMATVADLIDIALEKFHLLQQPGQEPIPRYRMLIAINSQGPETSKSQ